MMGTLWPGSIQDSDSHIYGVGSSVVLLPSNSNMEMVVGSIINTEINIVIQRNGNLSNIFGQSVQSNTMQKKVVFSLSKI